MKFRQYLLSTITIFSAAALTACNGGGNSSPTTSANYGQLVSESQQLFAGLSNIPISVLNPITLQAGDYVESEDYTYATANVMNTQESYNYDVQSISNFALANSVSAYAIQYKTPGQNADTDPAQVVRNASGLIIVPRNTQIRGVVVYFHPTTFGKNQVPSCIYGSTTMPDYCKKPTADDKTGVGTFAMLSSVFASRGFVVVAPDYLGQGSDWNNVHPYVAYPEANVLSAFNMFPAMKQILKQNNLNESSVLPLLITGYSEGGGYALKASQMAQNDYAGFIAQNGLKLAMTSPQEGAYSLKDQMNFAFSDLNDGVFNCADVTTPSFQCGLSPAMESDNVTINPIVKQANNWNIGSATYAAAAKPALTSYVLTAAMYYSFHNLTTAYNFSMNNAFWSDIKMPDGTIATLYQLYSGIYGQKYSGSQISNSIVANTMTINSYDFAESYPVNIYMADLFYEQAKQLIDSITNPLPYLLPKEVVGYGQNNQGTLFINQGITTNPDFQKILVNGSTYNWHTNSPINFIHMNYDSAVTVLNTYQAYSCMKYGKSFAGTDTLVASSAPCSTNANEQMIGITDIQNFQMSNNLVQLGTSGGVNDFEEIDNPNYNAISKFWTPSIIPPEGDLALVASITGTPFDHGDMFVLGSIIALCTFENQLESGTNSGVCPSQFNPAD